MNSAQSFTTMMILSCLVGCGGDGSDSTATPETPPSNPADNEIVGGFSVGHITVYDVQGLPPAANDLDYSYVGAAFYEASDSGTTSEPTGTLPIGISANGIATDICTYTYLVDESEGAREESTNIPLLNVGDSIEVTRGDTTVEVPLVDEATIPQWPEDQELPPLYALLEEGFDSELYDTTDSYGLVVDGAEALPGFSAEAVVELPAALLWQTPAFTDTHVQTVSENLSLTWEAGDGSYVVVDVQAQSGEGLFCVVADDGAFEVPAEQLQLLPLGPANLSVARATIGYSEIRLNEWVVAAGVSALIGHVDLQP